MKNVMLLLISLLTAQSMLCQNGSNTKYPKRLIIKGDTIVAFSSEQAKKIQLTKINLIETTEFSEKLKVQIKKDSTLIVNQKLLINGFNREIRLSNLIIQNDSIIQAEHYLQVEKLEKNLKRARRGNQILGGTVLTGIGILIGILSK